MENSQSRADGYVTLSLGDSGFLFEKPILFPPRRFHPLALFLPPFSPIIKTHTHTHTHTPMRTNNNNSNGNGNSNRNNDKGKEEKNEKSEPRGGLFIF
jgi:hypothetical protein